MAPNGTATSRKTPAKPIKSEDSAAVPLENLFDDLREDSSPKVAQDVKKSQPDIHKPGAWGLEEEDKDSKPTSDRSTPVSMNRVPSSLGKAFPNSKPMHDKPEILKCTHCKRAVSKHAMPKHIEGCLNKKQEKQRKKKEAKDARDAAARKEKLGAESDDDEDEEGKKTTGSKTGLGASKKRKAGDDAAEDTGPAKKKKKKDDAGKPKAARPKAPVDVEKQCGVELPQGGQCARSLTCKSHSMGAKRAVPGRSAPYDKLLMEYQRKNQAKLQKAQFDASAPNPDDENLPSGPVDSEEEKDAVLSSIARSWGGRPIYQPTYVPLRSKYQHNRIKGMLQSALGSRGGTGLFGNTNNGGSGGFFGAAPSASSSSTLVDDQGIVHARRGSVVPGARSMMAPSAGGAGRKASVASGA